MFPQCLTTFLFLSFFINYFPLQILVAFVLEWIPTECNMRKCTPFFNENLRLLFLFI